MMDPLISWLCVNPAHRATAGGTADTLTIHEGAWARCALDTTASGHEWRRTSGRPAERDDRVPQVRQSAKTSG